MIAIALLAMLTVFFLIMTVLYRRGEERDLREERLKEVKTLQAADARGTKKKEGGIQKLRQLREELRGRQKSKVIGQQISNSKSKKKLTEAEKMLLTADVQLTGAQFTLVKLALAVVLTAVFWFLGGFLVRKTGLNGSMTVLIALVGAILGGLLPARWLKSRVDKKKALFRDLLPNVMDLLVVSVEAGLGFDAALIRLYQKDKSPLMQELMRAMQDIQRGMSKKEAYTSLSERCGVKELTSFVNALIQADQMGISIRTVLKTQSEALREARRQRAEEQALKAPVKMLVPLVVFIFPVIFIVLLGPAVQNIMDVLG